MDVKLEHEELVPPEEFPFPFEPYSIQKDFMKNLFLSLEHGKLGIFESPTGTGKSQSLICGSLKWLLEHEERQKRQLANQIAKLTISDESTDKACDWIKAQAKQLEKTHSKRQLQIQLDTITKKEERLQLLKKTVREKKIAERKMDNARVQKVKHANENECNDVIEEMDKEKDDYLLEDDTEAQKAEDPDEADEEDGPTDVQIIICSRTHSQLSQLVGEIKKSPYHDKVRIVVLSSRNNYCINPSVRRLGSLALINERCCDLQNKKRDKTTAVNEEGVGVKKSRHNVSRGGCPYRPPAPLLGQETLCDVMDMEDVLARGKAINACPYYAARSAVQDAQLDRAHKQLVSYRDKYKTRFTASNILNLNQLIFVVNRLIQLIKLDPKKDNQDDAKVMVMYDFLLNACIDNLNMYNLLNFCKLSKLTQKLQGFVQNHDFSKEKLSNTPKDENKTSGLQSFLKEIQASSNKKKNSKVEPVPAANIDKSADEKPHDGMASNAMPAVEAFLECLTNPCEDGRIIVTPTTSSQAGSIKFLLLNPASHFVDVVTEARSVVVAGGTMKPIAEFRDQLFGGAGANKDRILHFSCGHVVSPDRILPIVLTSGPTKQTFDFSYGNRDSTDMLNELGRVLVNLSNIVPAGIVCFLTSYGYEKTVINHLEKTGVLEKIAVKKKIFREPKKSNQVEKVLQDYAKTIKTASSGVTSSKVNGALLFSVVGGKLSEGLNFSDDLGRCVILFGLPYPNIKSAQLQEKMSYLSSVYGNKAGDEHYENLCMKAVNQTIGRAIRHMGDYATIWLVDKRFSRPTIQSQLPEWIQTSLVSESLFGPAVGATARFFAKRKKS
ncbi:ATP-dependent DNA helicase DDX11 [Nilaparvata lugens]|uniref:ATP-dependent DNA helicase DDX11 n=1 Tax=Nilaparvata lugens TaxID=108931 RepID=UPI00193DDA4F|nr:ATP-dependent DNA helicase DDX11 [Nilaparvata lugens]